MVNGVEKPIPGISTVPVVSNSDAMNNVSSGGPVLLASKSIQNSMPRLSGRASTELSTATSRDAVACPPSPSVTVSTAWYVPGAEYSCSGARPVPVDPSPKFQVYVSTSSGPTSVATARNDTSDRPPRLVPSRRAR